MRAWSIISVAALLVALLALASVLQPVRAQGQKIAFDERSGSEVETGTVPLSELGSGKYQTTDYIVRVGKAIWKELQIRDGSGAFKDASSWELRGIMSPPKKVADDNIHSMVVRLRRIRPPENDEVWIEIEYAPTNKKRYGMILSAYHIQKDYERESTLPLNRMPPPPFRWFSWEDWDALAREEAEMLINYIITFGAGCIFISIGFFILAVQGFSAVKPGPAKEAADKKKDKGGKKD